MENPFKSIYKFNKEANLLNKGYSDFLEPSFLIEEALEDLGDIPYLQQRLHSERLCIEELQTPKECARQIVNLARMDNKEPLTDLQRLDKHIDAIVYAVGGAYKLGLTPQQLEAGIAAVMYSNMKKIGAGVDSAGKQLKPDNWDEIEAEQNKKLQAILDKREPRD